MICSYSSFLLDARAFQLNARAVVVNARALELLLLGKGWQLLLGKGWQLLLVRSLASLWIVKLLTIDGQDQTSKISYLLTYTLKSTV